MPSNIKVFISYSWDDDSHKNWVAALAADLREDGIETILDQWHAVPGDQLPEFMEREIRANDYVLIICTPNYRLKSDDRKGGVGYEGNIMTAEVQAQRNHRKFIPILARGTWDESAPSWLKGKCYVDLSSAENRRKYYSDLPATLLGTRPLAPPVRQSSRVDPIKETLANRSTGPGPLRIVGVIVDEVTNPTLDGTAESKLHSVPFRLNRQPSALWAEIFVRTWDRPPKYTGMHRPGCARVSGSKIILNRTTMEEVEKYHRETLILCVEKANDEEDKLLQQQQKEDELQRKQKEDHRKDVEKRARGLFKPPSSDVAKIDQIISQGRLLLDNKTPGGLQDTPLGRTVFPATVDEQGFLAWRNASLDVLREKSQSYTEEFGQVVRSYPAADEVERGLVILEKFRENL